MRDCTEKDGVILLDIMEDIKKKYIVDEQQNKIAVQIDIADFEKIERILEDYALGQLIKGNDPTEDMDLQAARELYEQLKKG